MYPIIYFLDKSVTFIDYAADASSFDKVIASNEDISRAKVLKILENHNNIAIISEDIEARFAHFAEEFKFVVAAGGVVLDNSGKTLMISRRGRWDLPGGRAASHSLSMEAFLYSGGPLCAGFRAGGVDQARIRAHGL